jgi:hypothetical protein
MISTLPVCGGIFVQAGVFDGNRRLLCKIAQEINPSF